MGPELDEVALSQKGFVGGLGDSLEDLGEISQVVDVMRLCWSGKQFFGGLDLSVELDGGVDDVVLEVGDSFWQGLRQVGEVPLQDSAENFYQ